MEKYTSLRKTINNKVYLMRHKRPIEFTFSKKFRNDKKCLITAKICQIHPPLSNGISFETAGIYLNHTHKTRIFT